MRRAHLAVIGLASSVLVACDQSPVSTAPETNAAFAAAPATHRYEVVITNLTTGQPLSPAVAVTHEQSVALFSAGAKAGAGIQAIAEDGNPAVAATALTGLPGVFDVVTTGAPVGIVGSTVFANSLRFEINAAANANFLSLATMLICTNDGFAALNSVRLPHGFREETVYAAAYDAGTEQNDEASGSIVPPCFGIGPVNLPGAGGGGRVAENGVVAMHPGIAGGATLSAEHNWHGPIARVTIRRVR